MSMPSGARLKLLVRRQRDGIRFCVLLALYTVLVFAVLHPTWFESTHLYGWQALFLLVVAGCWLAWVSRVRPVA